MRTVGAPDRDSHYLDQDDALSDIRTHEEQRLVARCAELQARVDQLQAALHSRVVIEQAKGMLAGRHGVTVDLAFETLRSHARSHNVRIHDLASEIVNGHPRASTG